MQRPPSTKLVGLMSLAVYVARSHEWLHNELVGPSTDAGDGVTLVSTRAEADLILYPSPPWLEPASGAERPWRFTPRELRRTFVYSQHDTPIVWAPGVYTSVSAADARPAVLGGFYVPVQHGTDSTLPGELEQARSLEPDLLWSFVGTIENARVRRTLAEVDDERGLVQDTLRWSRVTRWGWWDSLRDEGERTFREYAEVMGRSKFVVCPRGLSSNSIRIFEALQAGRCPVVIADDWLPPPFVDWSRCSLRVNEADADTLPAILREREEDFTHLGQEARATWERWFAPGQRLATLVAACRDLNETVTFGCRASLAVRAAGNPSTAKRLKWDLQARIRHRRAKNR